MKKFLALLFGGILAGCSIEGRILHSFYKACNVRYQPSPYYLQTPNETKRLKTGDCGDVSFLLLEEWKRKGIEGKLVVGKVSSLDKKLHAWCEVVFEGEEAVFDPTNNVWFPRKSLDKTGMYVEDARLSYCELNGIRGKQR
jgi:hypothetical protein